MKLKLIVSFKLFAATAAGAAVLAELAWSRWLAVRNTARSVMMPEAGTGAIAAPAEANWLPLVQRRATA
ncbi:hypothetical protein, partial [Massilia eurypsychrophila]|uniref:hypothetical protein n=1 Tax=Massilia eurypsychrophila TaxID=1485217 RepID=UPI0035F3F67E